MLYIPLHFFLDYNIMATIPYPSVPNRIPRPLRMGYRYAVLSYVWS